MNGFCFVTAVVMFVIGIAFFTGKAAQYIKDYQDMDEKEKSNIKINILCKNISLVFFIVAFIFAIAGYSEAFRQDYFRWVIIVWFVLTSADVIYIGKSKRFVYVYTPAVKEPWPFTSPKKSK
jgi:hypothetical protein